MTSILIVYLSLYNFYSFCCLFQLWDRWRSINYSQITQLSGLAQKNENWQKEVFKKATKWIINSWVNGDWLVVSRVVSWLIDSGFSTSYQLTFSLEPAYLKIVWCHCIQRKRNRRELKLNLGSAAWGWNPGLELNPFSCFVSAECKQPTFEPAPSFEVA